MVCKNSIRVGHCRVLFLTVMMMMMMVEVAVSHAKDVKEAKMNMKNDTQASDYCMSTSFAFAATR